MGDKTKSVLQKEIHIPLDKLIIHLPIQITDGLIALCVAAWTILPIGIAFYALKKQCIDYPCFYYKAIVQKYIYPVVTWFGVTVLLVSIIRKQIHIRQFRNILKSNTEFVCFFLLILWMTLATCFNGYGYWARYGTEAMGESAAIQIGYFALVIPLCALLSSSKWKLYLFRMLLVAGTVISIFAFPLYRLQVESRLIKGWQPAFTSIFINTNYFGYYLTVTVSLSAAMICFEKNVALQIMSIICLIINSVALSYNDTLGAWVGCFFACIFLIMAIRIREGLFKKQAWLAFILFLLTTTITGLINGSLIKSFGVFFNDLGLIIFDSQNEVTLHAGSGRWAIWRESIRVINDNPLFGIGFEGVIPKGYLDQIGNPRPHNEFLQYALFYGVPAGIFYFMGCLSVYLRAIRLKRYLDDTSLAALTAAFGYLVGSFFGLTTYNTAPYLFIMLGLGYVHVNLSQRDAELQLAFQRKIA